MRKEISLREIESVSNKYSLYSWQAARLYQLFIKRESFSVDFPRQVGKSTFSYAACELGAVIIYPTLRMREYHLRTMVEQYCLPSSYLKQYLRSKNMRPLLSSIGDPFYDDFVVFDDLKPPCPKLDDRHIVGHLFTSNEMDKIGYEKPLLSKAFIRGESIEEAYEEIEWIKEEERLMNKAW